MISAFTHSMNRTSAGPASVDQMLVVNRTKVYAPRSSGTGWNAAARGWRRCRYFQTTNTSSAIIGCSIDGTG